MILVDSSVWIDFLNGVESWQALRLREDLGRVRFGIGDLILAEVLQGTKDGPHFEQTLDFLSDLPLVTIADADLAVEAARNDQALRRRGVTIRKTVDTLVATRCIRDGHALLHSDRDFDAFAEHLGLQVVRRC